MELLLYAKELTDALLFSDIFVLISFVTEHTLTAGSLAPIV